MTSQIQGSKVASLFAAFALAYFLSALLRAVAATLAPALSAEFGLAASDLGLLAGAYFLGFSALQLPLGSALDRVGPKRVILWLMVLAVVGAGLFAAAHQFWSLFASRMLIGMGVAACLMAPLTAYRARCAPALQLRLNSWMLMTGSLGMLASTLPVQWLIPLWGWRGVFWAIAACLLVSMAVIAWVVPADKVQPVQPTPESEALQAAHPGNSSGYRGILTHPLFVRSLPLGFFVYGGLIAVQALWAGPWMTRVAGHTPEQAATGLFFINLCMLVAFLAWGVVTPALTRAGLTAHTLMVAGLPFSLAMLAWNVASPQPAAAPEWAAWCVATTFVNLSQPAVGQAFAQHQAGRALSAFNLVIFAGVFCIQWLIGVGIDLCRSAGMAEALAFRISLGVFGLCCLGAYLWYVWPPRRWRGVQTLAQR